MRINKKKVKKELAKRVRASSAIEKAKKRRHARLSRHVTKIKLHKVRCRENVTSPVEFIQPGKHAVKGLLVRRKITRRDTGLLTKYAA
jgi:hypothetical protein